MRLREIRDHLRKIHASAPLHVGQWGSLNQRSNRPIWHTVCDVIHPEHRNFRTIGYALMGSRGVRDATARRAKWLRRLILRDLGLTENRQPTK